MRSCLSRLIVSLILLLVVAYVGAAWYFSSLVLQSPINPFPALDAGDFAEVGLPEPQELTVDSADSLALAAWHFDNPAAANCGVVMAHGYTDNRGGILPYAPLFYERGCDVLMYDARGHGLSDEAPHTYGFHERQDVPVMVAELGRLSSLSPERIAVFGSSYGAATVLQAGPMLDEVAFVVADSPYQDFDTIVGYQAKQQYGDLLNPLLPFTYQLIEWRADVELDDISAERGASETSVPLLLLHSNQDEFTPAFNSEAIYAASDQSQSELALTDWGAAHSQMIYVDYNGYAVIVDRFIDQFSPDFGVPR